MPAPSSLDHEISATIVYVGHLFMWPFDLAQHENLYYCFAKIEKLTLTAVGLANEYMFHVTIKALEHLHVSVYCSRNRFTSALIRSRSCCRWRVEESAIRKATLLP